MINKTTDVHALHEYFLITIEQLNCRIDRTIHKVCIMLSNISQSFSSPCCLSLQAKLSCANSGKFSEADPPVGREKVSLHASY